MRIHKIQGILSEQERRGEALSYQQIDCAVRNLYGGWGDISEYTIQVLKAALTSDNLEKLFKEQKQEEELSKQVVLRVQKYEQEKITESNVEDIIKKALRKKKK